MANNRTVKEPGRGEAMEPDQLRKLWRRWHEASSSVSHEWAERGYSHPPPQFSEFPAVLRGLACGARTRAGTPCKRTDIYLSGRCKFHGGLSTGPTTDAGKSASSRNGGKRSP
jgi:hypothetical protein